MPLEFQNPVQSPAKDFSIIHALSIDIVTDVNGATAAAIRYTAARDKGDGTREACGQFVVESIDDVYAAAAGGDQQLADTLTAVLNYIGKLATDRDVQGKLNAAIAGVPYVAPSSQ